MKKISFNAFLGILLGISFASSVFAASDLFEKNLYFGLRDNSDVVRLQEFLTKESLYNGPQNGNFFALTKEGVQKYQKANNIEPASGYLGPITRESINNKLRKTTPSDVGQIDQSAQIQALRAQIEALTKQLTILQQATAIVPPVQVPETTTPIIQDIVATTTPEVIATTTAPALPSSFDSTLKITSTYSSLTLGGYGYKILGEFKFTADEKIAITKLRIKNNGTFPNTNISALELIDSKTSRTIAKAEQLVDGTVEFSMVKNADLPNNGFIVSGESYTISAFLTTPSYGGTKPFIRFDIEKASEISAFDYNDLFRVAVLKSAVFPVEGSQITAY